MFSEKINFQLDITDTDLGQDLGVVSHAEQGEVVRGFCSEISHQQGRALGVRVPCPLDDQLPALVVHAAEGPVGVHDVQSVEATVHRLPRRGQVGEHRHAHVALVCADPS